jgi:hypothetical protein
MIFTHGGVAEVCIIDAGGKVLRKWGFGNVLDEAGGDLLDLGQKEQDTSCQIVFHLPRPSHLAVKTLAGKAQLAVGPLAPDFDLGFWLSSVEAGGW